MKRIPAEGHGPKPFFLLSTQSTFRHCTFSPPHRLLTAQLRSSFHSPTLTETHRADRIWQVLGDQTCELAWKDLSICSHGSLWLRRRLERIICSTDTERHKEGQRPVLCQFPTRRWNKGSAPHLEWPELHRYVHKHVTLVPFPWWTVTLGKKRFLFCLRVRSWTGHWFHFWMEFACFPCSGLGLFIFINSLMCVDVEGNAGLADHPGVYTDFLW